MNDSNRFNRYELRKNLEREGFAEEFHRLTMIDVLRVLDKRKISIIVTFILSLILTIIYTYLQEPLYVSSAYIEVSRSFDFIEQQKYALIAKPEQIKSRKMLERVARSLKDKDEYSLPPDINDRIEYIDKLLYVSYTSSSNNYIEVRAVTNNAYFSADLANKTADIFVTNVWEDQQESSLRLQKYLKNKIPELREKANQLRLEIERIDNISNLEASLKEINFKKEEIRNEIDSLKAKLNQFKSKIRTGLLFKEELSNLKNEEIDERISKYEESYYDFLNKGFKPDFIDVQEILKKLVNLYMIKINNRTTNLKELEETIKDLNNQKEEAQKTLDARSSDLPDKEMYKRKLQSELKNYEEQLNYNTQKYEEIISEYQGKIPYIKFYKTAKPAFKPSVPNWSVNLYTGMALGIIFSIVYVIIIENFDPTLDDIKKIKKITNYPILGYIPYSPEIAKIKREEVRFLISKIDVKSLLAESFRVLKINLNFALNKINKNKTKIVSITSTNKSEGKSTVLLNLAISLSQSGKKILIIDCNLRRPTLYKSFGKPKSPGIIQFYENSTENLSFENIIQKTDIPNIDIIVSGGIAQYPTEILESEKFSKIINFVKEKYDVIFLDCPPLGLVIDAAVSSRFADGILIVYSMADIPKENLLMVIEQIEYGNINILGLVLNSLKKSTQVGYYRYYRHYKYKYAADENKKKSVQKPETVKI